MATSGRASATSRTPGSTIAPNLPPVDQDEKNVIVVVQRIDAHPFSRHV